MTRSPTVRLPAATPLAARYIIAVSAEEKMRFWPVLRAAREVATLMEAVS